eukprot:scaffold97210_cov36-Cyclotella_meneghiniana.AAC.1
MNVEGSQPAAFRCLSGVVATAAPDNQRNAGGAGPGLTTYRQPTANGPIQTGELHDVPSLGLGLLGVDRRRRPPPMYHTIGR